MRTQKLKIILMVIAVMFIIVDSARAQSKAYKRKKPATSSATTENATSANVNSKSTPPAQAPPAGTSATVDSNSAEKLDIQQLEQKYWAPKDTDFSVVQNRTYTKAKRVAVSLLAGPIVNDPFSEGNTFAFNANYYFDERYGVEFMFQNSNLSDSDSTKKFQKLSGGGVRPDFNRDTGFYGVGFNWVPFYAKMSFLGKKIIYFDMQVTPFAGLATYEKQSVSQHPSDSSPTIGLDVTQYFFFSQNLAVRVNLHNRFYKADVLNYSTGAVANADSSTSTTVFLMGVTYFY